MQKLKITVGSKIMYMNDIDSCTEITDITGKQIHVKLCDPNDQDPKFSFFEYVENGIIKILAVAGKVELIETPVTENVISTWEEKEKK